MRLADFTVRHTAPILAQWEAFAAPVVPGAVNLDPSALRDHALEILLAVAKDLRTAQTRDAQHETSIGGALSLINASETAAQMHALLRARAGFNINQLTAEYHALRASVLRLWMEECDSDAPHMDEVIRFNEAIDQALAESVVLFSAQVEQSHNLLLGMLATTCTALYRQFRGLPRI